MGLARIEIASINSIQAAPRARLEIVTVNLICSEAARWEVFITTPTAIEATLSYTPPAFGTTQQWTWPVTERLAFTTEIIQSHDRTEQRIAKRRGVPERTIGTRLLIRGDHEYAQLEAFLHNWLKSKMRVPLWFEAELHDGPIAAGSGSISLDTRYADYRDGYPILIWQSKDLYEYVYVDTFTDDTLTLWGQTVNAYEDKKWIMPARLGYAVTPLRVERHHGGALVEIAWLIEDIEAVTGYTASMTYDGYTVLTEPAHLPGDSAEISHDADVAVLDGGAGPFAVISNSTFNETGQSHVWHPWTKAACWELRQFLHNVTGRQSAFLVPTFRADLTITRPMLAGSLEVYVRNAGIANNMDVNALRKYIAFRPAGADIIPREMTAVEVVSAAEEKLTLDSSPGTAFIPGDTICWVDTCRLASDEITWTWHEAGKATVSTPLVRITS